MAQRDWYAWHADYDDPVAFTRHDPIRDSSGAGA
jgi:hypothetical protein